MLTVKDTSRRYVMEFSNGKGEVANLIVDMYEPRHWGYTIITNLEIGMSDKYGLDFQNYGDAYNSAVQTIHRILGD